MRLWDLLSLIVYNLSRRKGRVALTAIGVVIGAAAVVTLISLANGLQRSATNQFSGIGDLTLITVYPRYEESPVVMMGGGGGAVTQGGPSQQKLLTKSVLEEFAALPGVQSVIPRESVYAGTMLQYGKLETYANIMGVGVQDVAELGYEVKDGIGALERGTALIGEPMLRNFMDPHARPGSEPPAPVDLLNQTVKLVVSKMNQDGTAEVRKTFTLRIVGILKESRNEGDYSLVMALDDTTKMNEWIMNKRINRSRDPYDMVMVKAADVDKVTELSDQITEMGYNAFTMQSVVEGISGFYLIIQVIFGGVGAVALLVAAIGIANTMTMAILERTREIGLMKAVGATNNNVLAIFLGEAAGIGFVGGVGGVALGWLVGQAINVLAMPILAAQAAQYGSPPPEAVVFTPLWLPPFAVLFATLIGLLSGLYPALHAATIVPVLALKYE